MVRRSSVGRQRGTSRVGRETTLRKGDWMGHIEPHGRRRSAGARRRRSFTAALLALTLALLLAACGGDDDASDDATDATDGGSDTATDSGAADGDHPLAGQSIEMTILGIAGWLPSELGVQMSPLFAEYAAENYGYDVSFEFDAAPFSALFQQAAASLATGSNEYNIIISDSQWLGALAEPGWIVQLNDIIDENPELQLEWYSELVMDTYMRYPEGTDTIYGLPQMGDTIALFIRKSLLEDPDERAAFEAEYGWEMPLEFDDFIDLTMDEFEDMAAFFTRPEEDLYGTSMQFDREYDFMTCYLYPFMFGRGGEIWNPETREVFGVLNSPANVEGLEEMVRWIDYAPPGVERFGIAETIDAWTEGRLFSAFQWAAVGGAMVGGVVADDTMVVVPPRHVGSDGEAIRMYTMGGQPWVLNAFNTDEEMIVAVDFLKWWYQPETQLEFARRGGNPTDAPTLNDPDFADLNVWNRSYLHMLQDGKSQDFWKDPNYSEMLAVQQEAWTAFATGQIDDAELAMEWTACRQQEILFNSGSSEVAPPDSCADVTL